MGEQPIGGPTSRIGFACIGERKEIGRIIERRKALAIARRLCEPVVESAAPRARDVGHHAIERDRPGLIGIEALVEEMAQEPAALREAEADRALHRRERARIVLEVTHDIAHGREAEAAHDRIFCDVDEFVYVVRREAVARSDRGWIGDVFAVDPACEFPVAARHDPARPADVVADRQDRDRRSHDRRRLPPGRNRCGRAP